MRGSADRSPFVHRGGEARAVHDLLHFGGGHSLTEASSTKRDVAGFRVSTRWIGRRRRNRSPRKPARSPTPSRRERGSRAQIGGHRLGRTNWHATLALAIDHGARGDDEVINPSWSFRLIHRFVHRLHKESLPLEPFVEPGVAGAFVHGIVGRLVRDSGQRALLACDWVSELQARPVRSGTAPTFPHPCIAGALRSFV